MEPYINIRPFRFGEEEAVIQLWNTCLPRDPISISSFNEKIFLSKNFDPEGCLVAVKDETIIGFLIAVVRRVHNNGLGLEEDRGWITALFVHPEHRRRKIGNSLLKEGIRFLKFRGRKFVYVCGLSGSAPDYFWPGVDVVNHAEALEFFKANGFLIDHYAFSMERSLIDFTVPSNVKKLAEELSREGVLVGFLQPGHEEALLSFLIEHFPGDWHRYSKKLLEDKNNLNHFITASKNGEVIGYCHYEGGHFGPLGISQRYRRLGIGTLIIYKAMEVMYEKGGRRIWFYWADEGPASSFYERHGFKSTRKFAILRRRIEGDFVV